MSIQKYKDVNINGRDFRIGLVTALVGDWIIQIGLTHPTDPVVYSRVQNELLSVCQVYQEVNGEKIPSKIFDNGIWLNPQLELEHDLDTVEQIVERSLEFNMFPFAEKQRARREAKKLLLSVTQDLPS